MSTTQTDASHLVKVLIGGHISAVADRGNRSPEDKAARARDLWAVVASCEPQDAIQTILIGQALMLNELIADGGRDVLAGMVDTLKLRAQSGVNGMSRTLHQHVATFLRLRDKSEAVATTNAAVSETVEAAQRRLESAKKPPAPAAAAEAQRHIVNSPAKTVHAGAPVGSEVAARADAHSGLNGTHTPVFALNAAADPLNGKPLFRLDAEPDRAHAEHASVRD